MKKLNALMKKNSEDKQKEHPPPKKLTSKIRRMQIKSKTMKLKLKKTVSESKMFAQQVKVQNEEYQEMKALKKENNTLRTELAAVEC